MKRAEGRYIIEIDSDYIKAMSRIENKAPEQMQEVVFKQIRDFITTNTDNMSAIICNVWTDDNGNKHKAYRVQRISGPRVGKRLKRLSKRKKKQ